MQVTKLDHVNVHTANLDAMVAWYGRVLGMRAGERPPFPFPGAWLYCGDEPVVHLVGVDEQPEKPGKLPQLEHFAFSAKGLEELLAARRATRSADRARRAPGSVQVNIWDPDGNPSTSTSRPESRAELQEVPLAACADGAHEPASDQRGCLFRTVLPARRS
jgi:catechol 2,3-dioxygenase-like lactoylglutathione lyase family enzyme